MTKISKHTVPHQALGNVPVNVPMPPGAVVLSAVADGFRPVIYAVGEGESTEARWFQLLWTADPWPEGAQFVATLKAVPLAGEGAAVWHLVEFPALAGKETPF